MSRLLFLTCAFAAFVAAWFPVRAGRVADEVETSASAAELLLLLPADGEVSDCEQTAEPVMYLPDNLWEYIDGQSEHYLNYGFELVVVGDFACGDSSRSVAAEIYRMKNPLCGFGIYASERSQEDEIVGAGVEGYFGGNVLNFWKGPYYVKLTAFDRSPQTRDTLLRLAGSISGKIQGTFREPDLFSVFPLKDRIKKSERYIPVNFMGHSFLGGGYRVDYERGEHRYQVFLIESASREEATKSFDRYRDFLKSGGMEILEESAEGVRRMRPKASSGQVYFQYGSFFGGLMGAGSPSQEKEVIDYMLVRVGTKDSP